jgi:hypothetical protein
MRRDEVRPQRNRSLPFVALTRNQSQDIYQGIVSEEKPLAQELVFQGLEEMLRWLNLEPIPSMLPSWGERGCRNLP